MTTPAAPATTPDTAIPAGWYADPAGNGAQRYWDGSAWTGHVVAARPAPAAQAQVVAVGEVADRAPAREAIASMVVGGAVGLGTFLPWMSYRGESISIFGASAGVGMVMLAIAGFLGWYGYQTHTTGRVRFSPFACVAMVVGLMIAGANQPPEGADGVELGVGAALVMFGLLGMIWNLVVLWRHESKTARIEGARTAAPTTAAPTTPAAPARTETAPLEAF